MKQLKTSPLRCGTFTLATHPELGTFKGLVEYRGEVAVAVHVVKEGWTAAALRRQLTAGARADARACLITAAEIGARTLSLISFRYPPGGAS